MKFIDLTNKKFGRLTVIKKLGKKHNKYQQWLCRCDCGKEKIVFGSNLRKCEGKNSCGCLKDERMRNNTYGFKHGFSKERLHRIWRGMIRRCYYEHYKDYKNYGARGIKMSKKWKANYENFKNEMIESYKKHVSEYGEKNTSIDRINNKGNYNLNNCRWATQTVQRNNQSKVKCPICKKQFKHLGSHLLYKHK